MKATDLELPGLKLIELDVFGDHRGFFVERFNRAKYLELGLQVDYVQDNHSRSAPGVLRGLHYQFDAPQGKLVGVTRGRIFDVAVDLREGSPTFGKHCGVELDDRKLSLLWIPAGFAHGYQVIGDEVADVLYKVDALYNPAGERGIRFDDPELAVRWPGLKPQISERDTKLPGFAEYRRKPLFRWTR